MKNSDKNLWIFRQARAVRSSDRFVLLVLFVAGVVSILRFLDWWFRRAHIGNFTFFVVLSCLFWYGMLRLMLIWVNYLRLEKPPAKTAKTGLRVAIFTTSSPGEPLEMFEKTLAACRNITYPHTTYLLDDTQNPEFRACAEQNGAVWLELVGFAGAKAGKINAALQRTDEDFILVMDPDHIPFPNFLDHTLGYFEDEKVGFVQVCQAYYNQYRSFTAAGAAEQTYTFYGPTQMGLFGYGSSVAIGANCTFRRKALDSIGGHGIGLAEDLITSIRIHAAGWTSIYNPVVVSRGLVPEDFGSFCKQQLKWSRGVFEVTFVELPRLFRQLTLWQRFSYLTIGTYYLAGVTSFFFTLLPFFYFTTGILPARMAFTEFLLYGVPIVVIAVAIYLFVQRFLCHPQTERGLHWRGAVLKFACWPVFFLGFLLALVDADIPYIPTAKKAVTGYFTPFARPLVLHIVAFVVALLAIMVERRYWLPETSLLFSAEQTWGMIAFALVAVVMSIGGVLAALEANYMTVESPWDTVKIEEL
jgi:cellulose synthase (UDP-forming)